MRGDYIHFPGAVMVWGLRARSRRARIRIELVLCGSKVAKGGLVEVVAYGIAILVGLH